MIHPDSRAKAHHILLESEEAALALIPQIQSLEDFERLAREYSTCPSAKIGGDIGLVKPEVIVAELAEQIFSDLPLNQVLGPFKTVHGYHLVWIKRRHLAG
ncbi:peptidylprolyl isomerase [Thiomicrorhabdus xiamenensis]|uniref:Peptidyl-prolyl cis-trans isomerase C n=1 Tax=Thiomicrorhabdus xiamenensis TaxID=2739063 RepID=A0A7D4NK81_9GAMM|nr:peptidylprolyl isomerase [Thiomicrorhabdus xiamenensis]QKI88154.1 peptidylprolyl isomerase [Thiomicrorhabdus xiamenensis]